MLNHIVLQGRFTRDPELKRTQSGAAVCSFTLAVERDIKNQDGTRSVDFIDHVAWRGTAEMISKYFRKGSMAVTEGRLELRDWTDKDGNNRRAAEVRVANIHFGESKKKDAVPAEYADPLHGGDPDFPEIGEEDGELPF